MSKKIHTPNTGKTRNAVPVMWSDRCFPYAILGKSSKHQGMIGFFRSEDRPPLSQVPTGTMIVNLDTFQLEISLCDPTYPPARWLTTMISGNQIVLGDPTDGFYSDGMVAISGGMTVADAVDAINEQLTICCSGGGGVPEFASHLGTTDGNTDGLLVSPNFTIGRVSSPTNSGFYAGNWDDDINKDLTDTSSLVWELDTGEKITDLHAGTLTVNYITGTGIQHTEVLSLDGSTNNQASTPNGYITVSNLSNNPGAPSIVEGFLSITVPIDVILGASDQSGKITVQIEHEVTESVIYDQELEFFKDAAEAPSISNQEVYPGTVYTKYLSGVEFVSSSGSFNSTLTLVVESPDIFKDTYRADPLLLNSSNYGVPNFTISYVSSEVTKEGGSSVYPFMSEDDFVFSGSREITQSVVNPNSAGQFLTISAQVRDPFNNFTGAGFSGSPAFLLNTYDPSSTDTLELFVDEDYRLDPSSSGSSISGPSISEEDRSPREWNSQQSLVTYSGLQVVNGALVFPQDDWSSYFPAGNPDYTSLSGIVPAEGLSYNRQYRSISAKSNGILRVEGMTELDRTSGYVKIFIRSVGPHIQGNPTPGAGNTGTGWLDLSKPFDFGLFNGDDGDGCFITTGGLSAPNFQFSLGNFSTGFSENNAIEVMVIYPNTVQGRSKRITRMEITDW